MLLCSYIQIPQAHVGLLAGDSIKTIETPGISKVQMPPMNVQETPSCLQAKYQNIKLKVTYMNPEISDILCVKYLGKFILGSIKLP